MASRIFSIRLDDSAVEALQRLQTLDDDSLNATAKRVLLDALGIIDVNKVNTVNTSDDRLQELIDSKVAHLATAINTLKDELESKISNLATELNSYKSEIQVFEKRLNQHEEWFKKADEVNEERNALSLENLLLKAQLNNATTTTASAPDATSQTTDETSNDIPPNQCINPVCDYIGDGFAKKGFNRGKQQWQCPKCKKKSTLHIRTNTNANAN